MRSRLAYLLLSLGLVFSVGSVVAGAEYTAASAGGKVVIDGNLSDWQANGKFVAPAIVLNAKEQAVRGDNVWSGPADSSAQVYVRWTKDYLLVAADVTDDVGILGGRVDNGDSIGVDILAGGGTSILDFLAELTPYPVNGDWNQAVLFRSWGGSFATLPTKTIVRATTKAGGKGYYLEAAIPWSDMKQGDRAVNAQSGSRIMFNIILTDADNASARESVLLNTRSASNLTAAWYNDAAQFMPLVLAGDGAGTVTW